MTFFDKINDVAIADIENHARIADHSKHMLLTILCSGLVCSRPRSAMLLLHTMSSLPITVTFFICRTSAETSGRGRRQYRYWRTSLGPIELTVPNTLLCTQTDRHTCTDRDRQTDRQTDRQWWASTNRSSVAVAGDVVVGGRVLRGVTLYLDDGSTDRQTDRQTDTQTMMSQY